MELTGWVCTPTQFSVLGNSQMSQIIWKCEQIVGYVTKFSVRFANLSTVQNDQLLKYGDMNFYQA